MPGEVAKVRYNLSHPPCKSSPRYANSGWHGKSTQKEILKRDDSGEYAFRGSATSVLLVYPIWREFVRSLKTLREHADARVRERARAADPTVRSFQLLCSAMDGMVIAKRWKAPADLMHRVQAHLAAFIAAYGEEKVIPKHHWAFHVVKQIQEDDGMLFDCWVDERANKDVKRYARNVDNHRSFSRSVAARCVEDAVRGLETFEPTRHEAPFVEDAFLTIRVAMSLAQMGVDLEVQTVEASRSMSGLNDCECSVTVSAGDFLRGGEDEAGILVCCLRILPSSRAFLQLRECVPIAVLSPHAARWRETGCIRLGR